jgi:hypothetical protein
MRSVWCTAEHATFAAIFIQVFFPISIFLRGLDYARREFIYDLVWVPVSRESYTLRSNFLNFKTVAKKTRYKTAWRSPVLCSLELSTSSNSTRPPFESSWSAVGWRCCKFTYMTSVLNLQSWDFHRMVSFLKLRWKDYDLRGSISGRAFKNRESKNREFKHGEV